MFASDTKERGSIWKRQHEKSQTFFTWFTDDLDAGGGKLRDLIKDDIWPNLLNLLMIILEAAEVHNDGDLEHFDEEEEGGEREDEDGDNMRKKKGCRGR